MICLWIIYVTKKIWIFYGQEYVLIYLKKIQSFLHAKIESKMIHSESESESDFGFAINSVSDFDSTSNSDSDSDSESDFSSAFVNLDVLYSLFYICIPLNKPADGLKYLRPSSL